MSAPASVGEITEPEIAEVADYLARQVRIGEAVGENPQPPAQRLRWLLLDNPARQPGIPLGWRIRNEAGAIVGAAICIPFKIASANWTGVSLMFAKFYVDSPYRGMGLGLLMRFIREGRRFPLFVTSTNAIAGELFQRVGAKQIGGMDHTMLRVARIGPLAEEWIFRRTRRSSLSRIASLPGRLLPPRGTAPAKKVALNSELIPLSNAVAWAARPCPPSAMPANPKSALPANPAARLPSAPAVPDFLAVVRDEPYIHWRYFTGETDKQVFCFRCPGEIDRLVVVNLVRTGYRGQIRVVNVLDVWPPTSAKSAPVLGARLAVEYAGRFDAIWLRSQPATAEEALARTGFRRHAFPAPLGWFLDPSKILPTDQWYLMPGESE